MALLPDRMHQMSERQSDRSPRLRDRLAGEFARHLGADVQICVPATSGKYATARRSTFGFGAPVFILVYLVGWIRRLAGRVEFERRVVNYRVLVVRGEEVCEFESNDSFSQFGELVAAFPVSELRFERRNRFYIRVVAPNAKYWLEKSHGEALAEAVRATIPPMTALGAALDDD